MTERTNVGYTIYKSQPIGNQREIVLGHNKKIDEYVCWWYRGDRDSYFWGHYFNTPEDAERDLQERIKENNH